MTVHFICRGNTYRSRLAETYLNSKKLSNISVFSSGIEANRNLSGPVTWWAQRIIQNENLQDFESFRWQQATNELVTKADFTIFMNSDIFDFCVSSLSFNAENYEVWNIEDLEEVGISTEEVIRRSEVVFSKIIKKTEELIVRLQREKFV